MPTMRHPVHILATILVAMVWPATALADCPCMGIGYYRVDYLDHNEQQHSVVVVPTEALLANIDYRLRQQFPDTTPPPLSLAERFELALIEQEPGSRGWPILDDAWVLQPEVVQGGGLPRTILHPVVFTTPTAAFLNYEEVYRVLAVEHLFDLNCWPEVQLSRQEMSAVRGASATLVWAVREQQPGIEGLFAVYHGALQFPGLSHPITVTYSEMAGGCGC